MSRALALRNAAPAAPGLGYATMPQTPEGCVTACFSLESFDRRRGVAIYALRVVNRTTALLLCRTWAICGEGEAVLVNPTAFEVAPLSSGATRVPVWPGDFPSFERAVAEVVGEGIQCLVDAAPPARAERRRSAPAGVASIALALAAVAGAAALYLATPRITAFALPPQTFSGSTVRAEYEASGLGRLEYEVLAPNGRRVEGGAIPEHAGAFPIAIPASNAPGAYAVQLTMAGPLGRASETHVVNAVSGGAQIGAISVHPVVAQPGAQVEVSYTAEADGGYLRLIGSDGTVWTQKAYSSDGQTSFVIPPVANANAWHVLLHVTRGASSAESMAGIAVASSPASVPQAAAPATAIAGDDDPAAAVFPSDAENGTFDVIDRTVHGGDPIRVKILSPRNAMHVALTDAQSREVEGQDVGAEADVVTLKAPAVMVATRYTVVASFTDGFGQESVVEPVTILP